MAYELRGEFLEACDCHVICPCWFEQDPDEDECTGLIAWYVQQGTIDDVDVSGRTIVSVSHHGGHRGSTRVRVAMFVDEHATDQQEAALTKAFTGALGGPLRDLADVSGDVQSVQRAPIRLTSNGAKTELTVGQAVSTTMQPLVGSTGRVITVVDSALATVLGSVAEVGRSSRYKVDLGDAGFNLDLRDRSANRGRFAYVRKRSYG